ncbi:MAG: DHH family phosphoesterase [Thermoplasmata archaeon]|nr:DHH family phosphoesterase [Thermoplasmata archaeon]
MAERFEEAARLLSKEKSVRIVSHHDADGIFSAAVLSRCLWRKGIDFHVSLVKSIDEDALEQLGKEGNRLTVIFDLGSGQVKALEKLDSKVIVLDHHQTDTESSKVLQINPHLFGMDGAYVLCGSMLSFLLSIAVDEKNWSDAILALAGGIGDKQHLGGFKGPNSKIVERLVGSGELKVKKGLLLEGKVKGAVCDSIEPYFGIDETETGKLLKKLGIGLSARVEELGEKESRSLTSSLTLRLVEQGARSESLENLVGDVYWFEREKRSANSLADDVNACGRLRREDVGIALLYGNDEAEKTVKELREEYEKKIMENLRKMQAEKAFKKDHVQFFYCNEPRIAGPLAGIAMQYFLDQERPTFALSVLEKNTKVSCRATKYLVGKGLDLGSACRDASSSVGGTGGGHTIASGALVPKGKEEKFLELVDGIVGTQFGEKDS